MIKLQKSQILRWMVLCFFMSVFGGDWAMSAEIDFYVSSRLTAEVDPGDVVDLDISLGSHVSRRISLRLVELMQFEDGQLRVIDPRQQNLVVGLHRSTSCLEWLSFEPGTQQDFQISPLGQSDNKIMAKVPPDARGFYRAAVVAKVFSANTEEAGIPTSYECIAPVLIKIDYRPGTERIEIMDVGINTLSEGRDERGRVYLDVENRGNTLSRLGGSASIRSIDPNRQASVIDGITFVGMNTLPGSKVRLTAFLPESLAPGHYKVSGHIISDRAMRKEFTKTIELTQPVAKAPLDDITVITSWIPDGMFGVQYNRHGMFWPAFVHGFGLTADSQHNVEGDTDQIVTANTRWLRSRHWAASIHSTHLRLLFPPSSQENDIWDSRVVPECFDGAGKHEVLIEIRRSDNSTKKQCEPTEIEMPEEVILQIMPRM